MRGSGPAALLGLGLWLGLSLTGCTARTLIHPLPEEGSQGPSRVRVQGCNVRDFATAAELPPGSVNLGWVSVEAQETRDDTFLLLRQKICELGGNALSQAAWERDNNDPEAPRKLTANAWALP